MADSVFVEEAPEINVGKGSFWAENLIKAAPALKHKNYRLYFAGQLISQTGSWMQTVAQGWLVLQLTNSPFWVGLVSALGMLPILVFSLLSGIIVDSLPKRKILIFTQTSSMLIALFLGITTILGITNILEICITSFIFGAVNSLDSPARQSFVVEMVGKGDLHSAVALNSGIFNSARIFGPAIAGILIATTGTGGAFLLNSASFVAVIAALWCIRIKKETRTRHPDPLKAINDGIKFSFSHPIIRQLLFLVSINSIFGWSYATIMPVIAKNVFHLGAGGLGYLYSATGAGALTGAIFISAFSKKVSRHLLVAGGGFLFALGMLAFSFTSNFLVAQGMLFIIGLSLLLQTSTVNTLVQTLSSDTLRGRVMSIYTLMFMGFAPLGSLQVGFLAQHFGAPMAIRLGGLIILLYILVFSYNFNPAIPKLNNT